MKILILMMVSVFWLIVFGCMEFVRMISGWVFGVKMLYYLKSCVSGIIISWSGLMNLCCVIRRSCMIVWY